jgi:hypothetical protein
VAKTPAKKLKRGWRKKKWYGRHFLKEFPETMTKFNYNFVDPSAECCFSVHEKIG